MSDLGTLLNNCMNGYNRLRVFARHGRRPLRHSRAGGNPDLYAQAGTQARTLDPRLRGDNEGKSAGDDTADPEGT